MVVETYEVDDEAGDGGVPRCVWLEARVVRQLLPVHALRLRARVETEVRNGDAEPRHEAGN